MMRSVIHQLMGLRLSGGCGVAVTQVREKGHLSRPRLRNPQWFLRKEVTRYDDHMTAENKQFVNELGGENFGVPAIKKDVQENLIKTKEAAANEASWNPGLRRCGLIARKIGQYPLWLKNGERIRTTLLQIADNHVIKYIPPEEYLPAQTPKVHNLSKRGCILVGAETTNPVLLTKEYSGIFRDSGVVPKKNLARFIVSPEAKIEPGTPLNVNHFGVGDFVDVRGKTVDHGFQGVVKRHGFKGMPASHGVTKTHRRAGNIGGGGEKGRVWPGTKMPGHMGNRWRIIKGLRVWRINTKYNVMWVQGSSVPGPTGGLVYIYDTILPLRKNKEAPPFPTFYGELPQSADDIWYEKVHDFKNESITYENE
ncbi:39S ribosomal protein L3, mitochondrial [Drosophila gunungcola]|uniref:39S ribosomal protein L3, mitochondrial n=1 Tax=Drosophila gunungcola TaxID=103775 RepID=UPI0022E66DB2|nr:39S ribosomal protein L3, mitochondrial [Drosophila gunungcola]